MAPHPTGGRKIQVAKRVSSASDVLDLRGAKTFGEMHYSQHVIDLNRQRAQRRRYIEKAREDTFFEVLPGSMMAGDAIFGSPPYASDDSFVDLNEEPKPRTNRRRQLRSFIRRGQAKLSAGAAALWAWLNSERARLAVAVFVTLLLAATVYMLAHRIHPAPGQSTSNGAGAHSSAQSQPKTVTPSVQSPASKQQVKVSNSQNNQKVSVQAPGSSAGGTATGSGGSAPSGVGGSVSSGSSGSDPGATPPPTVGGSGSNDPSGGSSGGGGSSLDPGIGVQVQLPSPLPSPSASASIDPGDSSSPVNAQVNTGILPPANVSLP
jgi:hypothetical protein